VDRRGARRHTIVNNGHAVARTLTITRWVDGGRARATVAKGRSHADALETDGNVFVPSRRPLQVDEIVTPGIERTDALRPAGTTVRV